ncbi:MAG: RNA methyltransferase [Saprospiraceae bacterium]
MHLRKFRQKYGILVAEGVKTVTEIFDHPGSPIEGVYAVQEWLSENVHLVSKYRDKIFAVTENELAAISQLKTPNQVLCVLKQPVFSYEDEDLSSGFSLYLDDIRDPGNMGTILRIADWFGVRWVFCSKNCVEVSNPKVVQASMGAFLRVKTQTVSLQELRANYQGLPFLGTSLAGDSIFKIDLPEAGIIVIGNESVGISEETEQLLTQKIKIPRHPNGGAESLNAAVATGIICSVLQRF